MTREELEPLARVNVKSLKEYAYFTYAKIDGKRQKDAFLEPVDYFLDYDPKDTVLTLHFTLPFKTPVKAKAIEIEVYDPEFFIDFGFAGEEPVRLVSAPPQCTASVEKPHDDNFSSSLRLDKDFHDVRDQYRHGREFRQPDFREVSVTQRQGQLMRAWRWLCNRYASAAANALTDAFHRSGLSVVCPPPAD